MQAPPDPTSANYASNDATNQPAGISLPAPTVVPIIEEFAVVHREIVERGRIRLSKTITEHEEAVDLTLQHEEVQVERVPINLFVADNATAPTVRYEGDTLVVPVVREVMVKRLLLVEELHVTKHQIQTQETQTVTLRKEQLNVERLPAEDAVHSTPNTQPQTPFSSTN